MDNLGQALQKCELLKTRIREFETQSTNKSEESIRKIQIKMLKDQLSEVGRRIKNLTMYKRDKDD